MNDFDHLLARFLDNELNPAEAKAFVQGLSGDPARVRELQELYVVNRWLEVTATPAQVQTISAILKQIKEEQQPFVQRVLADIQPPSVARPERPQPLAPTRFSILRALIRPAFALACAVILVSGIIWLNPRQGEPRIAAATRTELLRAGSAEPVSARTGDSLTPGDTLRVGESGSLLLTFGREATRVSLSAKTEVKLVSLLSGKQFFLSAGKIEASASRQRPLYPMMIRTAQAEARVLGTKLTVTATNGWTQLDVAEGKVRFTRLADGSQVNVRGGQYAVVAVSSEKLAALPRPGAILLEWWTNVSWSTPADALADPRFPSKPDGAKLVETFELAPVVTNHFAVRFRGYLHPPETGDYEFWDASSGVEQLFLSPSEKPSEKLWILSGGAGTPRDWDYRSRTRNLRAQPFPLERGKLYYIEGISVTKDPVSFHFSVAWKRPGRPRELLDARYISPMNRE